MLSVVRAQLAPTGVLRAGINMSNYLLVTGEKDGVPDGVSPDMARAIAEKLGVDVELIPFEGPGVLADAVGQWDIGNIANEPERAKTISFSSAYCEIQASYLVPANSTIQNIEDVDQDGVRIVAKARAAYDLWLQDHIKQASIVNTDTIDQSFELFAQENYEVLAGLRPKLLEQQQQLPGSTTLDGNFASVQQSIGMQHGFPEAAGFLRDFVETAKAGGFVEGLIEKHGVIGRLAVAPLE